MNESQIKAIEGAKGQLQGELEKIFNNLGLRGQRMQLMVGDIVSAVDVLAQLRALQYVTELAAAPELPPELLSRIDALEAEAAVNDTARNRIENLEGAIGQAQEQITGLTGITVTVQGIQSELAELAKAPGKKK
jgi:hypothetical protein